MDLTTLIEIAVVGSRLLAGFVVVGVSIVVGVLGVKAAQFINKDLAR